VSYSLATTLQSIEELEDGTLNIINENMASARKEFSNITIIQTFPLTSTQLSEVPWITKNIVSEGNTAAKATFPCVAAVGETLPIKIDIVTPLNIRNIKAKVKRYYYRGSRAGDYKSETG